MRLRITPWVSAGVAMVASSRISTTGFPYSGCSQTSFSHAERDADLAATGGLLVDTESRQAYPCAGSGPRAGTQRLILGHGLVGEKPDVRKPKSRASSSARVKQRAITVALRAGGDCDGVDEEIAVIHLIDDNFNDLAVTFRSQALATTQWHTLGPPIGQPPRSVDKGEEPVSSSAGIEAGSHVGNSCGPGYPVDSPRN